VKCDRASQAFDTGMVSSDPVVVTARTGVQGSVTQLLAAGKAVALHSSVSGQRAFDLARSARHFGVASQLLAAAEGGGHHRQHERPTAVLAAGADGQQQPQQPTQRQGTQRRGEAASGSQARRRKLELAPIKGARRWWYGGQRHRANLVSSLATQQEQQEEKLEGCMDEANVSVDFVAELPWWQDAQVRILRRGPDVQMCN
jgi:hypothetical protein